MARISISLLHKSYPIHCPDGQEQHIALLAEQLDERMAHYQKHFGNMGDFTLLIYVALTLLDEQQDTAKNMDVIMEKLQHMALQLQQKEAENV